MSANMHEMELPRAVIVGENLSGVIAERIVGLAGGRAILLTSPTPYKLLGEKIEEESFNRVEFHTYVVDRDRDGDVLSKLSGVKAGVVVGVGGGYVLDLAKVVAETFRIPLISVPTIASHDGIASPMTSIRKDGKAYSRRAVMPVEIIADMTVIKLAPMRYTLSGCGDLVAKYSAVRDWWLAHKETGEYYGRYAAHLAYLSSIITMRSAERIRRREVEGVRTVVEALISAGVAMGIAGSSRPCSGSEHLIAHSLEYMMENPPLHGERCGVATIFTSYLHGANWRRVKESLERMGAPSTLKELGIDEDLFVEAVMKAPEIRRERYTILHKLRLEKNRVREVIHETGLDG